MQAADQGYPKRKSPRIPRYDYSTVNSYFITICTHEKKCIFWANGELNAYGTIAKQCFLKIPKLHSGYRIDHFVVMPNHIHAIITIEQQGAQTVSYVIGQYKSAVTRMIREIAPGETVWQRSFHDHVIRNQERYDLIWNYIENNPLRWKEDCFYSVEM